MLWSMGSQRAGHDRGAKQRRSMHWILKTEHQEKAKALTGHFHVDYTLKQYRVDSLKIPGYPQCSTEINFTYFF